MPLSPNRKNTQKIVDNEDEVIGHLCTIIADISRIAISERGIFNVGLSGGSMAKYLCKGFTDIRTDWKKWNFFLCDERMVPVTHPDSTLRLYLEGLVGSTPITEDQFLNVDTSLSVRDAAADYENRIRSFFPDVEFPSFDLLLLGMGPDGHTASLFPGHPLLHENKMWVAPISDSPKPPPCRVTLTLPVLNRSKFCIFAMAGEGKADMVKRVLGHKELLPSGLVSPVGGEVIWILDKAAASKL